MKIELSRRRGRGLQQIQLELDAQIKLEALSLPLPFSLSFSLSFPPLCRQIFTEAAAQINKIKSKRRNSFDSESVSNRIYSRFVNVCQCFAAQGGQRGARRGVNR